MSGNESPSSTVVLDSNVLIYLSKGQPVLDVVAAYGYEQVAVSVVAYMEALGFAFTDPNEKQTLEAAIHTFDIVQTDMTIADYVVDYRKRRRIKLPDAIILATARALNADLMTNNAADFDGVDPAVTLVSPF